VFESEFVITADMEGRTIYQLGLDEGRIVRLLRSNLDRRPVAVAHDELRRVVYWTDVADASIVSRQLTQPNSIARPITVFTAGINYQFSILAKLLFSLVTALRCAWHASAFYAVATPSVLSYSCIICVVSKWL